MKPSLIWTARLAGFLAAFAILLGPATAAPQGAQTPEEAVKAKVEGRLAKSKDLAGLSIQVAVEDKTVTISGSVSTLAQKEKAAKEAASAAKGYRLVDHLALAAPTLSADELATKVQEAIDKSMDYGIFDYVGVTAKSGGDITLQGWSYYPWRISEFGTIAKSVPGVTKLTNEVRSELLNDSDRALAILTARLIYHTPRMRDFGHTPGPIHIIVDNSVVKLAGTVNSEGEGEALVQLIRSNTGARAVVNVLTVKGKEENS